VDLKTRVGKVVMDSKSSQASELIQAVEEVGYQAEEITETQAAQIKNTNMRPPSSRWSQLNDSFLYTLLTLFAYILMLIFMTFNLGLILMIIGSMTFANFIFLFFSHRINDLDVTTQIVESDHCCDK